MSMNISFIITIDPCAIKNGRGSALLKPQNYAATTKGQQAHGHTKKSTLPYTHYCDHQNMGFDIRFLSHLRSFYGFALCNCNDSKE